ncbi:MAG: sodium:solute symporter [Prevotella sp.]
MAISRLTSRYSSNSAFFSGEHRSPWYMVAFGMIGASISGVTFVSVPGMVLQQDMTYLQTCLGFILGYYAVAYILLPLYYRLHLTTIYTYLGQRFGHSSHLTGTVFFFISKLAGAAIRFYVVCMLLQRFVLDTYGIPFYITVPVLVALIWLYTHRAGIKTLVWTDTLQTLFMFVSLVMIIIAVTERLDMSPGEAARAVIDHPMSRIFVFDDIASRQYFWKQFLSGIFIVIVMTGLDQDMMQKSLTCPTLRDAQKNLCSYGYAFVPANLLFLALGVLLVILSAQQGIALPSKGDELLPSFAATGYLGDAVVAIFAIGLVASSFSSADSALTALTTCFCIDICRRGDDERLRHRAHIGVILLFILSILIFDTIGSSSVIDLIYVVCGYTYGPLLGLFLFGMTTRYTVRDRLVPVVCILSPVICYTINIVSLRLWDYHFGYEMLMLNGLLTFLGLFILRKGRK